MKQITIVPYNPKWPLLFQEEAERIKQILGDNCLAVHHIGSTAVPGVVAKPIIDCSVVVKDTTESIQPLEHAGYRYKGEYNIPFRHFFSTPTTHLHIYEEGHPEIELNIRFRDYLRANPHARDEYALLKENLLKDDSSYEKNKAGFSYYTVRKESFIRTILQKTGFNELRMLICNNEAEWEAVKYFRHTYFCGPAGIEDPYTWTFDSPLHKHLVLYKGVDIIGYVHIQLWPSQRAAIRIIVIDKDEQNKGYGSHLLSLCEKWLKNLGVKSLHMETCRALGFYKKLGYVEMPFDDPDGYESGPEEVAIGKLL